MFQLVFLAVLFLHSLAGWPARLMQAAPTPTPANQTPMIQSPLPGQALQGSLPIVGSSAIQGFEAAELSFAYFDDPTETWFLIAQNTQEITEGTLAQWDTTTISDGIYTLRLVVTAANGTRQTFTVPGLRVRNYTPIETDTPTPVLPSATPEPGQTLAPSQTPSATAAASSATPLPPNPAILEGRDVFASVGQGAMLAVALFILMGLYASARALLRRS